MMTAQEDARAGLSELSAEEIERVTRFVFLDPRVVFTLGVVSSHVGAETGLPVGPSPWLRHLTERAEEEFARL